MSAPRKATAESENLESTNKHRNTRKAFGKDMEGEDSNLKDVISWESLPSSSQTPRSVTREVLAKEDSSEEVKFSPQSSQNDYEDILKDATESDSDPSIWATSGFLRDKWSSEDEELAGPSQTVPPQLHGIQIVSERELAQLAHVRPLIFSFHEQLTIKDCFNVLEKKVAEFEILQEFMTLDFQNLPGEFNSGNDLRNRDKNRYRDVLPYDSTRVPLGENKDYINASYIRIMNSGEEYFYIAAQGPLPSTTDDFWQMVLENNSNVIVMITKEIEGGVVKCHHYWPISMKKPLELKNCRIFMENYQILQCFIIRIFQVVRKSTGTSHFIKHLQFTNWPDHGTPAPVDGFIKYVRYVRKSHLTGPVLVHCSAGVGRTGVFLCVDVVFCAIEKNFPFNIKNIVAQMREQRYGMIQTKEQYCFCYKVVLEVLQKILTFD
ncbi:tyrosine-protein phosphatase non-receptor type 20 isoform X3 [Prionailurus viverrinus]|uniref:Tyrosine-protein phosphatase non-receptor type 20 isoform X1 n=2 Tax=Felinae TaxID=338152 RepID=A0A6J1ZLN7_ACIJB|nr:tyrosine-protein phosphatase non-receptor type 20 isoform X1 [Acinonyx jubatus]XP_040341604.1 tyrosine-protein phosphatase non-receptor type 20 isoform X1 [Puma yagouaroundi]XP_047682182.1 tyrosine-protein phosphatase non-receptor type 20 isoform X3 [Prionailurus viverrinus]XP_053063102.1 tyrosine-protein phosphatase non-receptor type 20 isoform X1 [Acinonyx jubatus]XP_053063103.1 tyrosine-protein phosphatase non-receptor type 20 isoform X1 [Acinonyx jubatus]XP_053063104.1 tyrosine-protein 